MKISIPSERVCLYKCVCLSVCLCACVCAPFMIIVSCWQNLFIWFAPSLVYFPHSLCLPPPPLCMCVCVREANKNYVKTCKYALTFDLWMTNDTPRAPRPSHVRQLLIMITLVTVSFVVNNGLVGLPSPFQGGVHCAQMKIDSLRLIEYVSLLLFLGRLLRCQLIEKV